MTGVFGIDKTLEESEVDITSPVLGSYSISSPVVGSYSCDNVKEKMRIKINNNFFMIFFPPL